MKWGVQHVKVTLKEESTGETIRIEQRSDGTVHCESGKGASKPAAATGEATRERPPAEKPAAEKPAEKPAEPRPARPANEKPAEKPAAPRPARPANDAPADPRRQRRTSALEWKTTRDAGFDGFLARSGAGQFKVLFNRTWALFFERRNEPPEPLGCFKDLSNAKENAQRLHDRGMRESELTADQVNAFCPPEATLDDPPPRAERRAKEATPTPAPAPAPEPAATQTMDASAEDAALRDLRSRIGSLVTSDDDDD